MLDSSTDPLERTIVFIPPPNDEIILRTVPLVMETEINERSSSVSSLDDVVFVMMMMGDTQLLLDFGWRPSYVSASVAFVLFCFV